MIWVLLRGASAAPAGDAPEHARSSEGALIGLGALGGEVVGGLVGGAFGYLGVAALGPQLECPIGDPHCSADTELGVVIGGSIGLGVGAVGGAAGAAIVLDRRLALPIVVTAVTAATGGGIALVGTGDPEKVGIGLLALGTPIAATIAGALVPRSDASVAVLPMVDRHLHGMKVAGRF